MQTVKRVVRKFIPRPIQTPPCPVAAEKSAYSAMFSLYDEEGRPTQRLVELAIDAVEKGMDVDEGEMGDEMKLLAGLMMVLKRRKVAVIGGGARQVIQKYLPGGGQISGEFAGADFILINGPG